MKSNGEALDAVDKGIRIDAFVAVCLFTAVCIRSSPLNPKLVPMCCYWKVS